MTFQKRPNMTLENVARCPLHFASLAKASIASAPEEEEEVEVEEEERPGRRKERGGKGERERGRKEGREGGGWREWKESGEEVYGGRKGGGGA
jgi:hypothetical protein